MSPAPVREVSVLRLVNGALGDPVLFLDFPGTDDAVLFDVGDVAGLAPAEARDVSVVLATHHHMDHWTDLDRVVRATIDRDKTVHVLGPAGTIERVERKLLAYEHQRFPFQKVVCEVTELGEALARARFAIRTGFRREPLPAGRARRDGCVLETAACRVRWAPASHTVPCVAYAVDVKRGWRFDAGKAAGGLLRPGPWIGRVLAEAARPRAKRPRRLRLEEGGPLHDLDDLLGRYFSLESPYRVGYLTDTRADPAVRDGLVELVRGSRRLYGDSYYPASEAKAAATHGHLTSHDVARLAKDAGVRELRLIHLGPKARRDPGTILAEARSIFPSTFLDLPEATHHGR